MRPIGSPTTLPRPKGKPSAVHPKLDAQTGGDGLVGGKVGDEFSVGADLLSSALTCLERRGFDSSGLFAIEERATGKQKETYNCGLLPEGEEGSGGKIRDGESERER